MANAIISIVLIFSLLGCQPTIQKVYIPTKLYRDPRPVLPAVKESELQCLSESAYQRLWMQRKLMANYCIGLETIIDSTKDK